MEADQARKNLERNQTYFRKKMTEVGFDLIPGHHPIIPVMLYDEKRAAKMADSLLKKGIYVIAFSYPVVPKSKARIRTQMSAAHTINQIDKTLMHLLKLGKPWMLFKK